MSVGLVLVSHSRALAEAAVGLATQMIAGDPPPLAIAAGMPDGGFGTDAALVAESITEVDGGEGVVVLTDLGSAILSAEMAVEFLPDPDTRVRIVAAPFVEGLLAALVSASLGGSLEEVAREATGALGPKREQLGEAPESLPDAAGSPQAVAAPAAAQRVVRLRNPHGLHARPAAAVAAAAAATGVEISVSVPGRSPVSARSPLGLAALGTRGGDDVILSADGPGAQDALETLAVLIEGGFGEADVSEGGFGEAGTESPGARTVAPQAAVEATPLPGRGVGVSPGRVVGPVVRLAPPLPAPDPGVLIGRADRAREAARIREAAESVASDLDRAAQRGTGTEAADILRATAALAVDPHVLGLAEARVSQEGSSAQSAIWDTLGQVAQSLREAGGLQAEREADVLDIRQRILASLEGVQPPGLPNADGPYVLVARDLAPADTAELSRETCLGIVTERGGPTSHTAILARALRIPAVVGSAAAASLREGASVLLDGGTGEVIPEPSSAQAATARTAPERLREAPPLSGPVSTTDGHPVGVMANIGGPADVPAASASGAQGVGLFRTEFCFLDRTDAPGEDEQAALYAQVLRGLAGHHVVLRTLDAGSDKPLPFLDPQPEPNPALGVRGLRTAREHPQILATQLAAMARAAREVPDAATWVMAPMVATAQEAADFAALARGAGLGTVGIMIETPAAALCAAELLAAVDFVSVGTNDLTQYTLAADRESAPLASLNDPWQPAVLRLIATIAMAGAEAGKPVGVCGEAAADPLLARVLVGLGVTSLSMNPSAVARVGQAVGESSLELCRAAAAAALAAGSPEGAREAALEFLRPGPS